MGLDVYLYSREQAEANDAHEKAWEAWYEQWGERPDSPEKETARKALPEYVSAEGKPSEAHPDHLFNRRYLRSSYNSSGFNRAVPDMVSREHDLHWIFEPVKLEDQYEMELTEASIPALQVARKRALQVASEIRACDPLRVSDEMSTVGEAAHMWHQLPTDDQVLDWYRAEKEKHTGKPNPWGGDDYSYSSAKGAILGFTKGMEVLAITMGQNVLKQPCAMFVYRVSDEVKEDYAISAEITAEFCEEAIALIREDGSATLHWSG
jgi:hypothetical protein